MRRFHVRQSAIIGIAGLIIALIALVLVNSAVYLNRSMEAQREAEENRASFQRLGQQLKDGSDYLTDQARAYVVTQDRAAMDNYWAEAEATRRRDKAVAALRAAHPPAGELALLAQAKAKSDSLMEAETHAMRLVAEGAGMPAGEMPAPVAGYVLPAQEAAMDAAAKSGRARELMFDDFYKASKQDILDPIARFEAQMGQRLSADVQAARKDTARTVAMVVALDVVALLLVAALAVLFHHFYLAPIQSNIRRLGEGGELLEKRGAWELQELTGGWNALSAALKQEIARRAALEADLIRARDRAQAGSRAKSLFLAQMSHEIRTPLNTITGYAQLLEDTPLDAAQRRYFDCIRTASGNLLDILNNVLDFSKLEAGQETLAEEDVDLPALLREVCALFQAQAGQKGLALRLEGAGEVPRWVRADPKKLRQVLVNLLSNALKFTARGSVVLRARADQAAAPPSLSLSVADTGPGIAPGDQARIFESFEQADASTSQQYGGTGLGLSISRGFLRLMGGDLTLVSAPGQGATFTASLPLKPGAPREQAPPPALDALRGRRVLVVDNNAVNLRMEQEMLAHGGLAVDTAESGAQAVRMCAGTRYAAVVLDVRMPGMDGMEAARAIRRAGENRGTPLVALSAEATESAVRAAKDAGMDAYLTKPVDRNRLRRVLAALCGTARPVPAEPAAREKDPAPGLLEELEDAFAGGDFEAIERVEQGKRALARVLAPEALGQLLEAARRCDMDACAALLRAARGKGGAPCTGSCS